MSRPRSTTRKINITPKINNMPKVNVTLKVNKMIQRLAPSPTAYSNINSSSDSNTQHSPPRHRFGCPPHRLCGSSDVSTPATDGPTTYSPALKPQLPHLNQWLGVFDLGDERSAGHARPVGGKVRSAFRAQVESAIQAVRFEPNSHVHIHCCFQCWTTVKFFQQTEFAKENNFSQVIPAGKIGNCVQNRQHTSVP